MNRWRTVVLMAALLTCVLVTSATAADQSLSYDIDLAIDYEEGAFGGRCVVDYTNTTQDALPELFFRLFANDSSVYGTASIQVDSVSVQGKSMPFALIADDTVLTLSLNAPLRPEDHIAIEFAFRGEASSWLNTEIATFEQTGYGLLTKSSFALALTAFYPMLAVYTDGDWALDSSTGFGDTLMGDAADYTLRVTTPSTLTPVASGKLATTKFLGTEQAEYEFTALGSRDFALVLVDANYVSTSVELDHATIRTSLATKFPLAAERTLDVATHAFKLYENLIGPSPFDDIDIVEIPLRYAAAMEFSGLVLTSSQLYAWNMMQSLHSAIIAHEMAHQWFYAGVGNDVSKHPWLDEGFATYLSYEFLEGYEGTHRAKSEVRQWNKTYDSHQITSTSLSINSPKYAFPDSGTYDAFVYSGGALFLHALRDTLGDDTFYQALQAYYSEFLHRIATPADLVRILEDVCACELDDLLSEFRIIP